MAALPTRLRHGAALVLVLVLAAALRVAPMTVISGADVVRMSTSDSAAYVELARSLLARHTFVRFPPEGEARIGNPWPTEVFRTPGYPVVIAGVMAFGGSARLLVALQVALDLAAILLCAAMGRRLFGSRVGTTAAAFLAVDLVHIVYANMIMSDVVFATAVTVAVWLTVGAVGDTGLAPGRRRAVLLLAGLAMSCACAVRPVAALAGVPLVLYATWRGAGRAGAALLLLGSLVFPAGWITRNFVENGVVTLSNAHTFNLYLLSASRVKARAEGIDQAQAFGEVVNGAVSELKSRGPGHWADALRAAGGWVFTAYPAATAAEAVRGMGEMVLAGERRMIFRLLGSDLGDERLPGINQGRRDLAHVLSYLWNAGPTEAAVVAGQVLLNAAIAMLAVVGVWRMRRAGLAPEAFLIGSLVVYFLVASLTVASARMRMPVSFLIDLAAAFAVGRPGSGDHP
jgi:hypothetical protein